MKDKVRLGFLGTGGIAMFHLSGFPTVRGAKIVALADPVADNLDRFRRLDAPWLAHFMKANPKMAANVERAKKLVKDVPGYSSLEEMLDAVPLDAVMISTPHTQHRDQMMTCINRGVHVLCEKPMTSTVADAKEVIAAAKKKKVVLTIAYQRHTMPSFLYIRDALAKKEIGDLVYVSVLLCQNYYRLTANTWRRDPKLSGGGQIHDSGSHIMDMLLFTTNARPTEVFCHQDNCGTPVDINTSTSVRFGKDFLASVDVVGRSPYGFLEEWTFNGTDGAIQIRDGKVTQVDGDGKPVKVKLPKAAGGLLQQFVTSIAEKTPPAVDPTWGLRVIQLTEAAWESARQNAPQKVDWTR